MRFRGNVLAVAACARHHDACAAGNGVNDSIATWVRKRTLSTFKFGRWRSLRHDQLTHEDIRDVAQIEALGLLETTP